LASPHRFAADFDSTGALRRLRNGAPSGYVNLMSTSKPTCLPFFHSLTLIVIADCLPAMPLVFRRARLRVVAVITEREPITRILAHVGTTTVAGGRES
jgi:hypothetical protein